MAEENKQQENSDITDFLKSLKEDEHHSSIGGEGFPFSDNFDIDAFVNQNSAQSAAENQPQPQPQPQPQDRPQPLPTALAEQEDELPSAEEYENELKEEEDFGLEGQESMKEQTIKHLEDKIAELESRFEDANKEKSFSAAVKAELEEDKEDIQYVPNAKANDEFFQNISTTIETLKGSLENIVSARLQYEESLIRQDQSLITRLREKTTRLKAINLALNSEVKRAKNEKLESLRRSAEQTKELLTLRMQLTKVEEKARHGDFKLSRMEQQLAVINAEKLSLDEEIRQVREEKLDNLRHSAEQTKQMMTLRLELTRTEEKFKQEEIQTQFLREQLKTVEEQRAALDAETHASRAEKEEAKLKAAAFQRDIENLKTEIFHKDSALSAAAQEAGKIKEKVLALESELQHMQEERASFQINTEENLRRLEELRAQHAQEIEKIRLSQLREIENIRAQKSEEASGIVLELRRAEDKYRQEQTFVETLRLQIDSLSTDIRNLQAEKTEVSSKLSQEIEVIKQNYQAEIDNLQGEFSASKERLEKGETAYNSLKQQLENIEKEKYNLSEDIKKVLSERDDAVAQNAKYLEQIEGLKKDYAQVSAELKDTVAEMQRRQQDEQNALAALKAKYEEDLRQKDNAEKEVSAKLKNAVEEMQKRQQEGQAALAAMQSKYEEELKQKDNAEKEVSAKLKSAIEEMQKRQQEGEASLAALKSKYEEELTHKDAAGKEISVKLEGRQKELDEAFAVIKERNNTITLLRNDLASLENHRSAIETEYKKASAERCDILKQLEEKDQELARYCELYENEIANLRQEKEDEAKALGDKLTAAQTQLKESEENLSSLKDQISFLEQEREDLSSASLQVKEENSQKAKKIAEQTEEILSLRSQLTKAESKFLQDTVLINQLREQFTVTQGSVRVLEQEVSKLKLENEVVKEESAAKVREIAALRTEISKTKEQLEQETLNVRNLQAHTSKLKAINSSLDEEIKKVQAEKLAALQKSAEQAKEILLLKEQLSRAESGLNTLGFQNGLVSLRKEYEEKVVQLETDLKDASALCARQVKEIQELRTDNIKLRSAQEERVRKEEHFDFLTKQVETLTAQLEDYKKGDTSATALSKVKAAALGAQITRVTKDRDSLRTQLAQTQKHIEELNAREKEKQNMLSSLKEQINGNDTVIQNLKREIMLLTAENKNLKELQKVTDVHQQVLETKISKVESESKKLSTMYGAALLNEEEPQAEAMQMQEEPQEEEQEEPVKEPFARETYEQKTTEPASGPAAAASAEAKSVRYIRTTTPDGKKVIKRIVVQSAKAEPVVSSFGEKAMRAKAFKAVEESILGKRAAAPAHPLPQRPSTELMRQAVGKKEEKEQFSVLDMPEPKPLVEEVNLETEEIDLSAIFNEDTFTTHKPKVEVEDTGLSSTMKDTTIKPMALKTSPPELRNTQFASGEMKPSDAGVTYGDDQVIDHSAHPHGVARKPVGRVPQSFRESQAYSDFLKKTRSMFFRIKWSLFKE